MELGVHFYTKEEYESTKRDPMMKWIFIGNYGCPIKAPTFETIKNIAGYTGGNIHYISPKVPGQYIEDEYNKISNLLQIGINVSINDWGIFYLLKKQKWVGHIYLGRMMTKCMGDSIWSAEMLSNEKEEAGIFLQQNNFFDSNKIEYFLENGIAGIEANATLYSEASLKKIKEMGLKIIGYADHIILAVSRSCPIRRLNQDFQCSNLCEKDLSIESLPNGLLTYPSMQLHGNVVVNPKVNEFNWDGYEILVKLRKLKHGTVN